MKNAGKACNNRLYRHIRTFEKIVKNYFVILTNLIGIIKPRQTNSLKYADTLQACRIGQACNAREIAAYL